MSELESLESSYRSDAEVSDLGTDFDSLDEEDYTFFGNLEYQLMALQGDELLMLAEMRREEDELDEFFALDF